MTFNLTHGNITLMKPRKYSGELWIDEDGSANFRFHIEGGSFLDAQDALNKFITVLQSRLDNAKKCPFYKEKPEEPNEN